MLLDLYMCFQDLLYFNCDLFKVIIIDIEVKYVCVQFENVIIFFKWKGNFKDKDLIDFVFFLEFIYIMQYDDVCKVFKLFEGKNILVEFVCCEVFVCVEYQCRLGVNKVKVLGGGIGWLSSYFGFKLSNMSLMVMEGEENFIEVFVKGKMLQDIVCERGMCNYLVLEEEICKNGEKWLKEE